MKFLVTGASGFLGGAVARAAQDAGHELIAIGRAGTSPADWLADYRGVDFECVAALAGVIADVAPDGVLHFAGSASVADSFGDPAADFAASTALWFRMLDAVRLSGRKPLVVLASSAAVYGSPVELPTPESAPRRPESPYGFHKVLSEQIGEEFARCFGLAVVSLRFFSVFGPRQCRLLIWEILDQIRAGAPEIRLRGTGGEHRDFLAEDEAALVAVNLAHALAKDREPGFRAINVASGASVSVLEVAEVARACVNPAARIVCGGEALRGNPARWQADISELRRLLPNWAPRPFAKSLAKCAEAWNSAPSAVNATRCEPSPTNFV
jgi:UDP-glucose 4-epimerase